MRVVIQRVSEASVTIEGKITADIGAGLLILLGIWHYRARQRQRLEAFRESLARDLHDEMGSTLSSIRFFSEYAKQQVGSDKPGVTPILQRISQRIDQRLV